MQLSSPIRRQPFPVVPSLLSHADAVAGVASIGMPSPRPALSRIAPSMDHPDTAPIRIALEIADGSGEAISIRISGHIARRLADGAREIVEHRQVAGAVGAAHCRELGELIASCSDLEIAAPRQEFTSGPDVSGEDRRQQAPLPKWRMKRVVEFVDGRLDGAISLADMAAAAGLSPMHFARQFRRATNMRPHEYLLRRRIERSQELLLAGNETLVEIALGVGFQGQAHFTTVFKRFTGSTPHQWRQENKAAPSRLSRSHPG